MSDIGDKPGIDPAAAPPTKSDQPRQVWLDGLRIAAATAVVFLHVNSKGVSRPLEFDSVTWWVQDFFNASVRWCVPVFVMISGALILPRSAAQPIGQYYRKRLSRVLIPTVVWTVVYVCISRWVDGFSLKKIAQNLLAGKPYFHLWFMFMLTGLYLVGPFLSRFAAGVDRRMLWYATAIGFAVVMGHSGITSVKSGHQATALSMWVNYVPYFFLGHLLVTSPPRMRRGWLIAIFFASVAAIAISRAALDPVLGDYRSQIITSNNLNPFVIASSVAVFLLAMSLQSRMTSDTISQAVQRLAIYALGVYLIHPIVLSLFARLGFSAEAFLPAISVPVVTACALVASLAASAVIAMIPGGRRLVC